MNDVLGDLSDPLFEKKVHERNYPGEMDNAETVSHTLIISCKVNID